MHEKIGGSRACPGTEPEMTYLSVTGEMNELNVTHADDGKICSRQK